MKNNAVIIIGDGEAVALAGGPLSLAELGERKTERASFLEFHEDDNEWRVLSADRCTWLFQHADYDVALAWERDYFNQRLAAGS